MKIEFIAVETPDGYEVKVLSNGILYTIADCYHVPEIDDAIQNAKRIALLLNQFFNHKQKENTMIRLECTRGGSNKFYEFHLIKTNGRFTVKGFYGAIGQAAKEHIIYDGESSEQAQQELLKKQREKEKKGYVVIGGSTMVTQAIAAQKKTVKSG